jgi:hypothetical protein
MRVVDDEDSDRAIGIIRTLHSADEQGSWKCATCHEINPSSFETCWKCNAANAKAAAGE